MENIINQYPLNISEVQMIRMPAGSKILSVEAHEDRPVLWAMANGKNKEENRYIYCYGTGYKFENENDSLEYLNTIRIRNGMLILHFFERKI